MFYKRSTKYLVYHKEWLILIGGGKTIYFAFARTLNKISWG